MNAFGTMLAFIGLTIRFVGGLACLAFLLAGLWNLITFDWLHAFVYIGISVVGGWIANIVGVLLIAAGVAMVEG